MINLMIWIWYINHYDIHHNNYNNYQIGDTQVTKSYMLRIKSKQEMFKKHVCHPWCKIQV